MSVRKSLTETISLRAAITVRERLAKRYHGIINLTKNLCFIDNDGNERPYSDIYEYDPARVENHQAGNAHLRRTTGVDREAFIAIEWVIYLLIIIALLTPYFITAVRQRFFAKCIRRRKKARRERKLQLEELNRRHRDHTRVILPIKIPQRRRIFLRNVKVDPVSLPETVPEFAVEGTEEHERYGFEDDMRSYDTLNIFEDRPSEVRFGNVDTNAKGSEAKEEATGIPQSTNNKAQLWKNPPAAGQKQKSVNFSNQPRQTIIAKTSQVRNTKLSTANLLKSIAGQGRAHSSPQVHQEQKNSIQRQQKSSVNVPPRNFQRPANQQVTAGTHPPQSLGRGTTAAQNQIRKSENTGPNLQATGRQGGLSP